MRVPGRKLSDLALHLLLFRPPRLIGSCRVFWSLFRSRLVFFISVVGQPYFVTHLHNRVPARNGAHTRAHTRIPLQALSRPRSCSLNAEGRRSSSRIIAPAIPVACGVRPPSHILSVSRLALPHVSLCPVWRSRASQRAGGAAAVRTARRAFTAVHARVRPS